MPRNIWAAAIISLWANIADGTNPIVDWVFASPLSTVINALGLGVLAFLFARGIIITSRQHDARIQDLKDHHAREMATKDAMYAAMESQKNHEYGEMKASRDFWREGKQQETHRADRATEQLVESNEVVRLSLQIVNGLQEAAGGKSP